MNPYEVMGLERSASDEDVRRAYKRLALKHHPDKNPGDAAAGEVFNRISAAYAILSDPARREAYDRFGVTGDDSAQQQQQQQQHHHPFANLADILAGLNLGGMGGIFESFGGVGGGGGQPFVFHVHRQGGGPAAAAAATAGPTRVAIKVSLADVRDGCRKAVEFDVHDMCGACGGTGAADKSDIVACNTCGGRGNVTAALFPPLATEIPCPACGGQGQRIRRACGACHGTRVLNARRIVKIDIAPGVPDRHSFTVAKLGNYCPTARRNADALVVVEHELPGWCTAVDPITGNVHVRLDVDFRDLLCGVSTHVQLYREPTLIEAPGYVNPAAHFVVRGQGLPPHDGGDDPAKKNNRQYGDIIVSWRVTYPSDVPQVNKYEDVLRKILKRPQQQQEQ
jgi:molecular chaperone DnaJ